MAKNNTINCQYHGILHGNIAIAQEGYSVKNYHFRQVEENVV